MEWRQMEAEKNKTSFDWLNYVLHWSSYPWNCNLHNISFINGLSDIKIPQNKKLLDVENYRTQAPRMYFLKSLMEQEIVKSLCYVKS